MKRASDIGTYIPRTNARDVDRQDAMNAIRGTGLNVLLKPVVTSGETSTLSPELQAKLVWRPTRAFKQRKKRRFNANYIRVPAFFDAFQIFPKGLLKLVDEAEFPSFISLHTCVTG